MLVLGRLYAGAVNHIWDLKWPGQKWYRTMCGQWKDWETIVHDPQARWCKSCVRIWKYDNRRPAPVRVNLNVLADWSEPRAS